MRDGFAEGAALDGLAAVAALVGEHGGEACVLRGGPVGGFAEAAVADDGDVAGVDVGVEDEVVERAAEAPGPEADGSPGVGCVVDGAEEIACAVLAGVFEVGLEVAVVGGGEAVAAGEQHA